jgi:hypothetical protein
MVVAEVALDIQARLILPMAVLVVLGAEEQEETMAA